jgi:putative DNA primase/helicase
VFPSGAARHLQLRAGHHLDRDIAGESGTKKSAALISRCAIVHIVILPYPLQEKNGKDLRDFLNEGKSYEHLVKLMAEIPPSAPTSALAGKTPMPTLNPNAPVTDPHYLAGTFLEKYTDENEGVYIKFWNDEWWRWKEGAYRKVPIGEFRAELTAHIKEEFENEHLARLAELAHFSQSKSDDDTSDEEDKRPELKAVTVPIVTNALGALAGMTMLPSTVDQPAWLADSPFPARDVLACRNGLIHLPSLVQKRNHFHKPTPQFFSCTILCYDFDPKAQKPITWLNFLRQLWPDDPQSIQLLQEWFGYCLLPDTRQQKILIVVGPKRSGKGTIGKVLKGLLGSDNVTAPSLSSLGSPFGLWPLLGKLLAIVSDARLSGRNDIAQLVENLLRLSGEDPVDVHRKFLPR